MKHWNGVWKTITLLAVILSVGLALWLSMAAEKLNRGMPITIWEYHWGDALDDPGMSGHLYDSSVWTPTAKPLNPPGRDGNPVLWLRTKLPPSEWQEPSILVRIDQSFRVYENYNLIYQFGKFDANGESRYQGTPPRLIPLGSFRMGEQIYFRVYSDGPNIGMSEWPMVGSRSDFLLASLRQQAIPFTLGCFYILMGGLSLYPFSRLRQLPFLSFGCFAFLFGVYCLCRTALVYLFYDNPPFWMYTELISLIGGCAAIMALVAQLFAAKDWLGRVMMLLWKLHLLYGAVYLTTAAFGWVKVLDGLRLYQLLLLPSIGLSLFYMLKFAWKGNGEAQTLTGGMVAFSFTALIDIWDNIFLPDFDLPSVTYLGMLYLVLSLIVVLIGRAKEVLNRLRSSEKLSIAGQLAAGIAHEIRNPMTVISGNLQLMLMRKEQESSVRLMLSEVNRINEIMNEFLVLARPNAPQFVDCDVGRSLQDVLDLFRNQADTRGITFDYNRVGLPCVLRGDPNQLKQVFINIVKNAIEAMPNGGRICVRIVKKSRDRFLIRIADEGTGIDEKDLAKLSTPFFTTKENGTGLGLSISRKIVEEHGGTLRWKAAYPKGTVVEIELPVRVKWWAPVREQEPSEAGL
ncbi:ATP-binding protein [Paenibacillus sp. J31TS4]|uniref:ATP-binding protein n=1 Tax=Paenibacillus sp. J31TS4 TaxID=2807195 RepID=UPI0020BEB859|nr:ATP-binding protein [Paenibacillus sp. J31TS4]